LVLPGNNVRGKGGALDVERIVSHFIGILMPDRMVPSKARARADFKRSSAGITEERVGALPSSLRGLSLRQNFVWTFAGNVVYAACQWGMLVALAKLGSPEMVGQFALGLAIGAPVMMLANLQLRGIQATDARNEYQFSHYLALRVTTTTLAFSSICLIAWLAGFRWQTALVVILVGIAKSVESISNVVYGLMQKYERLDRIAIAMILRGVGSVVLMTLALWLTHSVAWAVATLAAWWALVLGLYECTAARWVLGRQGRPSGDLRPLWDAARMKSLAWLSLPLGAAGMLVSLDTNIPRYFVEHSLGEAALGYFVALAYVMVAGYTVMNALGQSAAPRLARYFVTNRAAYLRLLGKMAVVAGVLGTGGILVAAVWGRWVLTLIYRPDYAEYHTLFTWLMVATTLSYLGTVLSYGMTAARELRPQAWFQATSLGINILVCLWLVPVFGMYGAAWALILSGAFKLVSSVAYMLRVMRSDIGHWVRS
jgi:O-antigen/teichoic acid export membrane protein